MISISQNKFPAPIRTVEGITEYRLDNGLQVLLFPDSTARNITVNVTYLVGSRHEGRGESGMAHLLEHMLFKGTPTYPDVDSELQARGAIYNATTWLDRTNYFETLPGTDDNLEFALKFEADRMLNCWIRQEDLDAEMTVVRNEFEMGENHPESVLHDQIFAAAYSWHNYGKPTIGNRSDIERVPIKNLQAFYHHYYQPDNASLMVAGNFNMAKAQAWIMQYFGSLPKPERILDGTYTEEPTQDGPRHVILQRAGELALASLAYHIPAAAHPDFAALTVLTEVLGAEPSGLLYQKLVKSGKASEAHAIEYALREPGMFMVYARPTKNEEACKILLQMQKQLENLSERDIKPDNVERAKSRILTQVRLLTKNSNDLAIRLTESIAQGDYRLFFFIRDQVKLVTADDVLRVAKTYLLESNRTSGLFVPMADPKRAIIPLTPEVNLLLDGYSGSEEMHLGEEFEATTDNIDLHTQRLVLAGTIKTAVLPKKTRGRKVEARLIFRFGNTDSLKDKRPALQLIPSLLRRGTKNLSFQKVEDTLHKLHSAVSIY
ncbi:MAG TPA: pitrilysin family protein, partial [Gammaproteobacteria bacterium]|nr:pitrilysin family protein [Gammaproteobacteria bacterium]